LRAQVRLKKIQDQNFGENNSQDSLLFQISFVKFDKCFENIPCQKLAKIPVCENHAKSLEVEYTLEIISI
jgi:hypothetical protein